MHLVNWSIIWAQIHEAKSKVLEINGNEHLFLEAWLLCCKEIDLLGFLFPPSPCSNALNVLKYANYVLTSAVCIFCSLPFKNTYFAGEYFCPKGVEFNAANKSKSKVSFLQAANYSSPHKQLQKGMKIHDVAPRHEKVRITHIVPEISNFWIWLTVQDKINTLLIKEKFYGLCTYKLLGLPNFLEFTKKN